MTPSGLWPEWGTYKAVVEVYSGGRLRVWISDNAGERPDPRPSAVA